MFHSFIHVFRVAIVFLSISSHVVETSVTSTPHLPLKEASSYVMHACSRVILSRVSICPGRTVSLFSPCFHPFFIPTRLTPNVSLALPHLFSLAFRYTSPFHTSRAAASYDSHNRLAAFSVVRHVVFVLRSYKPPEGRLAVAASTYLIMARICIL